jgi:D-alanyl-D-alanine carboxypeptidase/D-alanyl-D-alanine-endopeptidase (penicillin-binding protein 4)
MARHRRWPVALALVAAISVAATPAQGATPHWIKRIDRVVAGHPMSVVVGHDGHLWYRHKAGVARPPASNEKLLLSMALFDRFGTGKTFPVRALSLGVDPGGVISGDLYVRGEGDPEVADARLNALAARIWHAGVREIGGRVIGVRGPFHRDWFAPGWKSYFPKYDVALPTALTFRGNTSASGKHISDPERRAAAYLTRALRDLGVTIGARGTDGSAIAGLSEVTAVSSKPLRTIVRHMDRRSINFSAEVLGKALAFGWRDAGTIANGAARICGFEAARGVSATCHDGSGLSYANRQTALGIVRMLWAADRQPWGGPLRMALPDGGQGTLRHRLRHVRIRAKTGTLIDVSALSGWVWSDAAKRWVEFSILSNGMNAYTAKDLEDKIVEVLAARAKAP